MSLHQEVKSQSETAPTALISFLSNNFRKIFAILIWASLLIGYTVYARANDLTPIQAVQALADILASPIGPLIFIAAYAVRPLLFFSATVLTLAAGSIYGPLWGIVLTIIASNLSAMIAYGVGRYFGADIINEDESAGLISRYSQRLRNESFATVMIMRLLFLPYDLVNYLSGFLRINWKSFLLATALGSLPGTVSFVLFGSSINIQNGLSDVMFNPVTLGASIAIIVICLVISRFLRRREQPAEG